MGSRILASQLQPSPPPISVFVHLSVFPPSPLHSATWLGLKREPWGPLCMAWKLLGATGRCCHSSYSNNCFGLSEIPETESGQWPMVELAEGMGCGVSSLFHLPVQGAKQSLGHAGGCQDHAHPNLQPQVRCGQSRQHGSGKTTGAEEPSSFPRLLPGAKGPAQQRFPKAQSPDLGPESPLFSPPTSFWSCFYFLFLSPTYRFLL